jgi:putative mRNA 3-end processing factor
MNKGLLRFTERGIYCEEGHFFIDPWRPVERAIITHGHADHARWGHQSYLCHTDSVEILRHRLGATLSIKGIEYNDPLVINGVKVSLHPAGHLLGSAQVRVEHKGEVWVASGDYKTDKDPIAVDFEPVPCHTFITECTFGLPIYNWPDSKAVMLQMEEWWKSNQKAGKISLISAYSLGKAQRILEQIDETIGPLFVHGAVNKLNHVHQKVGFLNKTINYLGPTVSKSDLEGALVIAPSSAINSTWSNRLRPFSVGVASGWMMIRGSKRRQNVDRGFVLSDHADWNGLNEAIDATGAERIICTHGYTGTFKEWLIHRGFEAFEEKTLFEGESLNASDEEDTEE